MSIGAIFTTPLVFQPEFCISRIPEKGSATLQTLKWYYPPLDAMPYNSLILALT